MKNGKDENKVEEGLQVRTSPEFKLKDRPNRKHVVINLKDYGFIPETLIVEKVLGRSNTFVVHAVLTDAEKKKMKKHDKAIEAAMKKEALKVKKKKNVGKQTKKPATKAK